MKKSKTKHLSVSEAGSLCGKSSWAVRIRNKTPEEVKEMMSQLGKKSGEARILNLKK